METTKMVAITVETTVQAPIKKAWLFWTSPDYITKWNHASEDWHTPFAKNDLRVGGKFLYRMEAKDGSFGFDFNGVYGNINNYELIEYSIEGGRKVSVRFTGNGNETKVVEMFEAEDTNPVEMQRAGWQAILDNFKKLVEASL